MQRPALRQPWINKQSHGAAVSSETHHAQTSGLPCAADDIPSGPVVCLHWSLEPVPHVPRPERHGLPRLPRIACHAIATRRRHLVPSHVAALMVSLGKTLAHNPRLQMSPERRMHHLPNCLTLKHSSMANFGAEDMPSSFGHLLNEICISSKLNAVGRDSMEGVNAF